MDLRQLRYLVALNEHRSFVRAAEAMGITQPAFSRSIQGLEQELGCVLIDRASKDLRPTPEGQIALQHALALIRGASNLTSEITQMSKLDAGDLHFGCGPALVTSLLPDALLAFMQRYPRIRTRFEVDNWEQLSRSLNRGEIEFFIADIRHGEADPGVQTQPLRPRAGLFFCRPEHPLLGKESLSTNDLFDFPLAASRIPSEARKVLANLSGKVDISIHLECEQIPLLVQLVKRSDAIGMATHEAVADELASGALVQLHLRNLPNNLDSLSARCGIVTRTGFRLSPAAKAMIDLLLTLDHSKSAQVA
ncbi:LysR family transcriptional regulator [Ectopseudomonas mendocina]|uniref:LysR family transcriptional regulator n=1 Tax=Ectopseudomonas mendocina TaxID=300 RepID=A0A2R3QWF4_ECTME|nr:LysR family transcriptional regulator [Pseudomonas mendocina]AVO56012.1 LysR family transcriptional regulator [Pseudomonas mendocina]